MAKKYICLEYEDGDACGIGATLEEAYENYCNSHGDRSVADCCFYEAEEIEVESKIIKKEKPVKAKTNKPDFS